MGSKSKKSKSGGGSSSARTTQSQQQQEPVEEVKNPQESAEEEPSQEPAPPTLASTQPEPHASTRPRSEQRRISRIYEENLRISEDSAGEQAQAQAQAQVQTQDTPNINSSSTEGEEMPPLQSAELTADIQASETLETVQLEQTKPRSRTSSSSSSSTVQPEELETVEGLKNLGNIKFAAGDYVKAIALYDQALHLDPNNATLHSNRSAANFKLGNLELAMEDAEKTIELNPTWSKGYWRKANVQMSIEKYAEAIETLDKGLLYNPIDRDLVQARKHAVENLQTLDPQNPNIASATAQTPWASTAASTGPATDIPPLDVDDVTLRMDEEEDDGLETEQRSGRNTPGEQARLRKLIDEILQAKTFYKVFGVQHNASLKDIKLKYYSLARDLHPDKCRLEGAESAMQSVTAAYSSLSNPVKKGLYDRYIAESATVDGNPAISYSEWEARQSFTMLPPVLACLLRIPILGWTIGLTLFILLLPALILLFILYGILYILCLPYRLIMMCCCPELYADMREKEMKEEQRMEEDEQYRRFSAV